MPDQSLGKILDHVEDLARKNKNVTVSEIVGALGSRSYGPFLLVPPLVEFSPLGGIPGVPTALAAVIILFAAQMLLGLKHLWIPQFLSHRGISGESLKRAAAKIRPLGDWLDRWLHGRLPWLTSEPFVQIAAAACIIFALTVPPLELFPFASSAPMATIAMFGLALLVQDGVLMIVGSVLAVTALVVGFGFFAL